MPNHVRTIIFIEDEENLNKVLEFMKGEPNELDEIEDQFDFNRLIPMPAELSVSECSSGWVGIRYHNGEKDAIKGMSPEDQKEAIDLGAKYIENKKKYGHQSWYGWCNENWGTKWNAYDEYLESPGQIEFSTAWGHPFPILEKLSEKFPDILFEVKYADENTGYNVGHYTLEDGELIDLSPEEGSKEAYEIAFELNGGEDMYRLVNGEYEYYEEEYEDNE